MIQGQVTKKTFKYDKNGYVDGIGPGTVIEIGWDLQ